MHVRSHMISSTFKPINAAVFDLSWKKIKNVRALEAPVGCFRSYSVDVFFGVIGMANDVQFDASLLHQTKQENLTGIPVRSTWFQTADAY